MRAAVQSAWFKYSSDHEGFTPFPYCDTLNLVTSGIGNLMDSSKANSFDISAEAMASFVNKPWRIRGPGWSSKNPIAIGTAGFDVVQQAFITCKLQEQKSPGFNKQGGGAYAKLTNITLDMQGIQDLFANTTASFEKSMKKHYPNWDDWPADAQMAGMSMAWANGPNFDFPKFKADVLALNFAQAAVDGQFRGGGAANVKGTRNSDNALMFANADRVIKSGGDREVLYFPSIAPSSVSSGATAIGRGLLNKRNLEIGGGVIATGLIGRAAYEWWRNRR